MKTLIWTWTTRVFHWLLAIGFLLTMIFSENETNMNTHFAFGALVGSLVFFRLLFGFIGPRYARFSDFPMGVQNLKEFAQGMLSRFTASGKKEKEYAGHNPLASVVMLVMMISIFGAALSGYFLYASVPLMGETVTSGLDSHSIKEVHEAFAMTSVVCIVLHLLGVLSDTVLRSKSGTLVSIFSGYKNLQAEPAKLHGHQKIFFVVTLLVSFAFFYIGLSAPAKDFDGHKKNKHSVESSYSHDDHDDD